MNMNGWEYDNLKQLYLLQIDYLKVGEETPFTTRQFVFVETGKHHAVELQHLIAEMFEDAAHNTVAARMEFYADFLLAVVAFHVGNAIGSNRTVIKFYAIGNAKHIILGQRLV